MKFQAILPEGALQSLALRKGTVIALNRDGAPLVRATDMPSPIACDVLDTGLGAPEYQLGQSVLFITYDDPAGAGCILGAVTQMGHDAPARRRSLRLEVEEFIVKARSAASIETE